MDEKGESNVNGNEMPMESHQTSTELEAGTHNEPSNDIEQQIPLGTISEELSEPTRAAESRSVSFGEPTLASGLKRRRKHKPTKQGTRKTVFYEENVNLIPGGDLSSLKNDINFGKDRERHWHVIWPKLLRKQVWLEDTKKRPEIVTPRLPTHKEYMNLGNGTTLGTKVLTACFKAFGVARCCCSRGRTKNDNNETQAEKCVENEGPVMWPRGVDYRTAEMYDLCKAMVLWVLHLKPNDTNPQTMKQFDKEIYAMYKDTWWTFYASFVIGVFTPFLSVLVGFLVDEATGSGFADVENISLRRQYVVMFGLLYVFLYLAILRTQFYWNVRIPGFCMQQHLRWVLYRRMRVVEKDGDEEEQRSSEGNNDRSESPNVAASVNPFLSTKASAKFFFDDTSSRAASESTLICNTPGVALAVLGPIVEQAVMAIVEGFFKLLIIYSGVVSAVIIATCLITVNTVANSLAIILMFVLMVVSLGMKVWIFNFYLKPMKKLERLTAQWQVRYYALAVEQLTKLHARLTRKSYPSSSEIQEDIDDWWVATRLYRYRAFQSGIMELTVQDLVTSVVTIVDYALVIVFGFETIAGRMSVGTFVALSGLAANTVTYAGDSMGLLTAVPGGYRALQQVAEVMNQTCYVNNAGCCTPALSAEGPVTSAVGDGDYCVPSAGDSPATAKTDCTTPNGDSSSVPFGSSITTPHSLGSENV